VVFRHPLEGICVAELPLVLTDSLVKQLATIVIYKTNSVDKSVLCLAVGDKAAFIRVIQVYQFHYRFKAHYLWPDILV
jgi:hypothetical protein